ncbi:cysteine-rich receptor-like protein kinase 37 [Nymphaea colorata]|uniref:cysteine-rich receptor-like protein kinase 37 n=1 Tax=Nymphaea colorata TaxID=210225 RepID=UPI00214E4ED2|nr:cysteine-rich receptor-like protein kinase 37 [Nymphaea colorata]
MALGSLLKNLTSAATTVPSRLMFAMAATYYRIGQTLYGLVQCTRDTSLADCKDCLYGRHNKPISSAQFGTSKFKLFTDWYRHHHVSCTICGFYRWKRDCFRRKELKARQLPGNEEEDALQRTAFARADPMDGPTFDLDTIRSATNDFAPENKLREGGFGAVYRGELSDGQEIAVKRLSRNTGNGPKQFDNEMQTLANRGGCKIFLRDGPNHLLVGPRGATPPLPPALLVGENNNLGDLDTEALTLLALALEWLFMRSRPSGMEMERCVLESEMVLAMEAVAEVAVAAVDLDRPGGVCLSTGFLERFLSPCMCFSQYL